MKIGFTGTQLSMTQVQRIALQNLLISITSTPLESEIHLGDCIGADGEAHDLAFELSFRTIGHLPCNSRKQANKSYNEVRPRRPYLVRNRNIVQETDLLIATPS
jgi:hypothetical protein